MTAKSNKATFALYFGFGSTYQTDHSSITWTDVSTSLLGFRARQAERNPQTGQIEAGVAEFVLDNQSGDFEPEHTGGAYSPDVKVGVPAKLEASYHGYLKSGGLSSTTGGGYVLATNKTHTPSGTATYDVRIRVVDMVSAAWQQAIFVSSANRWVLAVRPTTSEVRFRIESGGVNMGGDSTNTIDPTAVTWLRATLDTSTTTNSLSFYTSTDLGMDDGQVTWTLLETINSAGTGTADVLSTPSVNGIPTSGNNPIKTPGGVHRVVLYEDSTKVLDYDPYRRTSQAFTDDTGWQWVRTGAGNDSFAHDWQPAWFGFVEAWPQSYPEFGKRAVVRVPASDGFGRLARSEFDFYDDAVLATNPKHYWRLNEASGTVAADFGQGFAEGSYVGGVTLNQPGPGEGQARAVDFDGSTGHVLVEQPEGALNPSGGFTIEAWINPDSVGAGREDFFAFESTTVVGSTRHSLLGAGRNAANFVVYFQAHSSEVSFSTATSPLAAGTWTHVAATVSSDGAISLYIDGELSRSITSAAALGLGGGYVSRHARIGHSGQTTFDWNGKVSRVAVYEKPLRAEAVLTHYENQYFTRATDETADTRLGALLTTPGGWPTADRNLDTGVSALTASEGQGNVLRVLQGIADDDYGVFYQHPNGDMTFDNRHHRTKNQMTPKVVFGPSDAKYANIVVGYDEDLVLNRVNVTGVGGINVTARDATAEADHGIVYVSESRHLDTVDAAGHAALRVYQNKDVKRRVESLVVTPESDPAHLYPWALGLRHGDRVTVKWTPPHGTEMSFDVHVESVTHSAAPGDQWRTELTFSPAEVWDFWLLGTGTLGTTSGATNTRLGY